MSARCPTPTVVTELCTKCGLCVEACPCGAVTMGEHAPVFTDPGFDGPDCTCAGEEGAGCIRLCEEVCPTGAIICEFSIVAAEPMTQHLGSSTSCACSGGSNCSAS